MPVQTLQFPLSVPGDAEERRQCARRIETLLNSRPGIHRASVSTDGQRVGNGQAGTIEMDYDPRLVSLSQINGYLRQMGSCFDPSIAHVVMSVEGLVSPRHERTVEAVLNKLPGVRAFASYVSQTIRLEFDRRHCALPEIVRRLDHLGMRLRTEAEMTGRGGAAALGAGGMPGLEQPHWLRTALTKRDFVMAMLAGAFLLAGFFVHMFAGPGFNSLRIALLFISYICGGWYTAMEVAHTLRRFRVDIDVLMFAAAFGAASLGHFEEGALLLFLFSIGGAGERLAMNRARNAIKALSQLAPQTATLITADGEHQEVPVEKLNVGDQILVTAASQIAADGRVVAGASAVNQAPITGESVPVEKVVGNDVFAGTINGDGVLTVEVTRRASDNTLARVIRLVEEAQTTKSPTQLFTDKVETWYVPLVLVATGLLIVGPPLLRIMPVREGSLWAGWFYQSMAFLTAASPCALAIGTPAAILSGIGRAARGGVLIKGGVHLENLGRVRVVAIDKTGTLTLGRPEVTDVVTLGDALGESELLALAAAVERGSRHPIADAIVTEAESRDCPHEEADDIEQVPGLGIRGRVNGRTVTIGRPGFFADTLAGIDDARARADALASAGKTTVVITDDSAALGLIALADQPRPHADEMIRHLKALGVAHTIMLTGDNARTAQAIAEQVGISEYLAELLPEDKLTKVRELDQRYGRVAMVGDGVNDAPAMANATVGIAVGGATGGGSDVALETADICLLADDLRKITEAVALSRFTRRIITQNLFIALGVIAVLAPIAALGAAPISAAVFFHEGSTVVVVLNALRILAYRAIVSGTTSPRHSDSAP